MIQGFLGRKVGMSQVFREDGIVVPVTVVEAGPCVVTQIKTQETDGYEAVQLGFGEVKKRNKPMAGHFSKSRLSRYVKEVKADDIGEFQVGQSLTVDIFQPGEFVDVTGRSKGRGFSGVMKRHGFAGGPRTHGQSDRARAPGSIGGGTTPGRVYKGMKMPGHMGNRRITVKGIEVIHVDLERNLLLLKGAVPGSVNWLLEIHRSVKPSKEPIPLVGLVREAPPAEEPEVPVADGEDTAVQQPENQEAENQETVAQEPESGEPEVQDPGDQEQADPEPEEQKPE
ncbi:MAG: 50S ribosomal protein L3 [Chloroflexi bacterium]|nr:50S ribosomal protein L3 [Chloroflexota bacterium]